MKTDLTYSQDKMFTTFYAESAAGEDAWREMANKMNGVAKVLNFEAKALIIQLRGFGYSVRKAAKPTQTIDQILKELGA